MSLPQNFRSAVAHGDLHSLALLLDEQPQHANSFVITTRGPVTFLEYSVTCCAVDDRISVAQLLLARGARVNSDRADSISALHRSLFHGTSSPETLPLVRLLLAAGANVDALHNSFTPLGYLIALISNDHAEYKSMFPPNSELVVTLLRAGASLDVLEQNWPPFDDGTRATAVAFLDEILRTDPSVRNNEEFFEVRALLAGVREDGSWKSYARRPHRSILRLRSLYTRGRATLAREQRRKPRGADARRDRAILFLVKLGDNGVLWNVLSFWRATD